ncbi:MAG TPA: hypothetical protein VMZ28_13970 [Kofleriaceae bacterium]|nr:hypothetical protein [Kofleriaceae bacterium]
MFLALCSTLTTACADIGGTDEGVATDVRFVPAGGEPVSIGAFDEEAQEVSFHADLAAYGDGVKVFMPDDISAVAVGPGTVSMEAIVVPGDEFPVYSILPGTADAPAVQEVAGTIEFTLDAAEPGYEVTSYEVDGGYTMLCEFYPNYGYQDYWNHGCYFCHDDWVNYESYYWCW